MKESKSTEHYLVPDMEIRCSCFERDVDISRGDGLLYTMILIDELCFVVRGRGVTPRVRALAGRIMALNYRFNNMAVAEKAPGHIMFF